MGNSASAELALTNELSKPIHASDVNTPRGVSARAEVRAGPDLWVSGP